MTRFPREGMGVLYEAVFVCAQTDDGLHRGQPVADFDDKFYTEADVENLTIEGVIRLQRAAAEPVKLCGPCDRQGATHPSRRVKLSWTTDARGVEQCDRSLVEQHVVPYDVSMQQHVAR